jgi:hypothetical protein
MHAERMLRSAVLAGSSGGSGGAVADAPVRDGRWTLAAATHALQPPHAQLGLPAAAASTRVRRKSCTSAPLARCPSFNGVTNC